MGKEIVYQGIHFRVYHEDVRLTSGRSKTFEYIWRRDGTRVLAVRSDHTLLLCREFRYELNAYDWRLPGGKLDDEHEEPIVAAAREFSEETGFRALSLEPLGRTVPFATVHYGIHFFVTYNPLRGESNPEEGESIDYSWFPLTQAGSMAISGEIREEISALTILRFIASILTQQRTIPSADEANSDLHRG